MSSDTTSPAGVDASALAIAHLELDQPLLDTERVIAMLRTRAYAVDRLTLTGSELHVRIVTSLEQAHLLEARLRRIEGPRLRGTLEWRR